MSDIRHYNCLDKTRFATGINSNDKYQGNRRQIATSVDEELFALVKAEAIREGTTISEVVRVCLELVLK